MRLYVVRHAIAEDVAATGRDADRALTPEGRSRMRAAAAGLHALGVRVDAIVTSPFRRAAETADIVAGALGAPVVHPDDDLAAGATPAAILRALRPHRELESVAIVGHQPDLGQFVSKLTTGEADASPLAFKKGAIACLDTESVAGAVRAALVWFMTTKQLRLIGER